MFGVRCSILNNKYSFNLDLPRLCKIFIHRYHLLQIAFALHPSQRFCLKREPHIALIIIMIICVRTLHMCDTRIYTTLAYNDESLIQFIIISALEGSMFGSSLPDGQCVGCRRCAKRVC